MKTYYTENSSRIGVSPALKPRGSKIASYPILEIWGNLRSSIRESFHARPNPILELFSICIVIALLPRMLCAIYSGNPIIPAIPADGVQPHYEEVMQPRIGYLGDFLCQVPMRIEGGGRGEFSGNFDLITLGGSFYHRFLLEFLGGSSSAEMVSTQEQQIITITSGGPSFGLRLQGIVKQWRRVVVGVSGSAAIASSIIRSQTNNGVSVPHPARMHLRSWQVGAGLAIKNETLAPYLGLKVGDLRTKIGRARAKMSHHVGGVVGCSISAYAVMVINLEARFIDERSVSLSACLAY